MFECYRGGVSAWQCDVMGHMNVRFYLARFTDALEVLASDLGIPPDLCLHVEDHHLRFLRELRAGAAFHVDAGVVDVGEDRVIAFLEMCDADSGEPAATARVSARCVDCMELSPAPLPEIASERAASHRTDVPDHGAPRGLGLGEPRVSPSLEEAVALGMFRCQRGPLLQPDVDHRGHMAPPAYIARISEGIPHMRRRLGVHQRLRQDALGSAALEYRFVYRDVARPGSVLTLYAGLANVTSRVLHWVHWLFEERTGRVLSTSENVVVPFDLKARRAVPIADDVREKLQDQAISGLGV